MSNINKSNTSPLADYQSSTNSGNNHNTPRVCCPKCNSTATKLGAGKGSHTASLSCAGCGRWIKWIGKAELAKLGGVQDD